MIMYRYVCAYVHIKEGILEEGVVATTSKKWANEIQSNVNLQQIYFECMSRKVNNIINIAAN